MKTEISETHSEEETVSAGRIFGQRLQSQDVVFLHGDLGSGKTTFTKGIAEALGVSSRVISPTFVLVRTHQAQNDKGIETLYHLDLYRLGTENEAKGADLADFLNDKAGVVVIEWPEVGQNLIKKNVWNVYLSVISGGGRKIVIEYE